MFNPFFTLSEHTPRPMNSPYFWCCVRAVVRHQLTVGLPGFVFLCFGFLWMPAAYQSGLIESWTAGLLMFFGAGLPPAAGAVAIWRWISARLYPFLDAHPQDQDQIKKGYQLPPRPAQDTQDTPFLILGECHSTRSYIKNGDYTPKFTVKEEYSPTPMWSILPASSLVTGLVVFGGIGSGKTSYVLKPSVFKMFAHPSCPGGLVMDSKGQLVEPLREVLEECGRIADFFPVGPRSGVRWNPLHAPLSKPSTLANFLMTALENLNGAPFGSESRWIRSGAAHLAESGIGLLRLLVNYVTADSLRTFLGEFSLTLGGSDSPGAAAAGFVDSIFESKISTFDDVQKSEFDYFKSLLVTRGSEDEKFRQIYLSELQNVLIPLCEPTVLALYNSPEDQLDMPSWQAAVNDGLIVVLDCNSRTNPGLSVLLGMLLKLSFQDSMLARLDWIKQKLVNPDRFMLLAIDEYQDFCSPNDSDYLALARESKAISIFLTQGHASLVQRVGLERTNVILQSLRNKLVLTQDVPEPIVTLLGKSEQEEVSKNIGETVTGAGLNATGKFSGDSTVAESLSISKREKDIVSGDMLRTLPRGQAILQSHDGTDSVPTHRVFLRPYFAYDKRFFDVHPGVNHA